LKFLEVGRFDKKNKKERGIEKWGEYGFAG
jgi:hypothetical protein